jgi:hypothetical protein
MKHTHLFAFALAAALTAVPTFAQQDTEKPADAPKHEKQAPADKDKDKAVKPESGSIKSQEAGQEKSKPDARQSKIPQSDQEPGVKNESPDRKDASHGEMGRENQGTAAKGQPTDKDRNAHYQFKGDAKTKLRSSYKGMSSVNRSQRVTVVRQQVLPVEVQTRIEPVPVDVVSYLGPAPDGFSYGFVDGYCVVYDPMTFFVIDVIDLF